MNKKRVLSFVGAGGKTTGIFRLAAHYRSLKKRVLVTTTTHMMPEEGLVSDLPSIREALDRDGFAFAAVRETAVSVRNGKPVCKVVSLPDEVLNPAIEMADITLIEADGARGMPFKVPRSYEPVIHPATTAIVIVAGEDAVGKRICDVSMNPDDVSKVLGVDPKSLLTREDMIKCVKSTYLTRFCERYPDLPVFLFINPKIPGMGIAELDAQMLNSEQLFGRKFMTFTEWDEGIKNEEEAPFGRDDLCYHFLILAAGYSKRFGDNKLLSLIDGKPMYRFVYDRLLHICRSDAERKAGVQDERTFRADLTVVTQYEEIRDRAEADGVRTVINPDPSRGISSSLQCGVSDLLRQGKMRDGDVLVVFTADQPNLKKETIVRFLKGYAASGKGLGCVGRDGVMGNPCAFSYTYTDEIMSLGGDKGGKRILQRHPEDVFIMEADSDLELQDIDYPKGINGT